jgi:protein-tyrosine-phosphatase
MPPPIGQPVKVLFVCLGNACRSQMAEALARHVAAGVIVPASAGTMALGDIPDLTRQVLEARGVAMDGQTSKNLTPEQLAWADLIVNMTGLPAETVLRDDIDKVEDWEVADPYGQEPGVYEIVCDEIESRLGVLTRRLRQIHARRKM